MEMIEYGPGKELKTRAEALTYAYTTLIPKVLKDSGLNIEEEPEIIEGRKAGIMYIRVFR